MLCSGRLYKILPEGFSSRAAASLILLKAVLGLATGNKSGGDWAPAAAPKLKFEKAHADWSGYALCAMGSRFAIAKRWSLPGVYAVAE